MAAPVQVGGAGIQPLSTGLSAGPWLIGGALYIVSRSASTTMSVYKSTDPFGAGWTLMDSAHAPVDSGGSGTYYNMGVTVDAAGNIHVAMINSAGYFLYGMYDPSTDTWTRNESAGGSVSPVAGAGVGIAVRSNGDVVCLLSSAASGVKYHKRTAANGTWGGYPTASASNGATKVRAVIGAADRVHFFYGGTSVTHRSLDSTDVLDTEATVRASMTSAGQPIAVTDETGTHICLPMRDASAPNHVLVARFDSAANPAFTVDDVSDAAALSTSNNYAVANDGPVLYAAWLRNSDSEIMTDKSAGLGGAWGADDASYAHTATRVAANIYPRAGNMVLGLVYCTESNGSTYFNEIVLRELAHTFSVSQQGGQQRLANPSFEADALNGAPASWPQYLLNGAPAPTTYAVQNGWASDGVKSMRLTTGNHGANNQGTYMTQTVLPVVPGARYSLVADFNVLAMPNTMIARVMIEWHDAANAYISQSYGPNLGASAVGQVFPHSQVIGVAPANAVRCVAIVIITGGTGVGDIYVDNLSFQYVPTLIGAIARTFAVTAAQAVAVTGSDSRKVSTSQSQSPVVGGGLARKVSASQSQSPAVGGPTASTVAGAQGAAVTLVRALVATRTIGQVTVVALATTTPPRTFTASQPSLSALGRAIARTFAATQGRAVARSAGVSRILALAQDQGASTRTGRGLSVATAQDQLAVWRALSVRRIACTQPQSVACTGAVSRRFSVSAASTSRRGAALRATLLVTQPSAVSMVGVRSRERLLFVSQSQVASIVAAPPVLRVSLSQTASATCSAIVSATRFVAQGQGASVPMRLVRGILTAGVLEARADHDILRPRVLVGAVAASTLESEQR